MARPLVRIGVFATGSGRVNGTAISFGGRAYPRAVRGLIAEHTHNKGRMPMLNTSPTSLRLFPNRRHPSHHAMAHRHNTPVILHVTVCTVERQPLLALPAVHDALCSSWRAATKLAVGYYIIMPEHIHFFAAPTECDAPDLRTWARYWKRMFSQRMPEMAGIWQADCWDTQMRSADLYRRKLEYVELNPVRKGLVAKAGDWPYQGRIQELIWLGD